MSEEFKSKQPRYGERLRYINRFISLNCSADIMIAKLFPNAKEISESMAAVAAVEKHICDGKLSKYKDDTAVLCVGDGFTPRTASLFAFMTRWTCYSVDPNMASIHGASSFRGIEIQRLHVIGERIEDCNIDLRGYRNVVLVGVHSHSNNDNLLRGAQFTCAHSVMMPCCVHQPPMSDNYIEYRDDAVWSPHNKITISLGVQNGNQ